MEMTAAIRNIDLQYGELRIFRNFSIEFAENQINCILGPSGCGKTSLLNIIAGLLQPEKIAGNDFENKDISYVFQDPRLLPWLSVEENIAFVLRDRMNNNAIRKKVDEYLEIVRLEDFRHYYPSRLSGGMKQRVALARAFCYPSDVILMDEPFKGLDIKLKKELTEAFQALWNHRKATVVWVSHDVDEAVLAGRKIFVFSGAPVRILKSCFPSESEAGRMKAEICELLAE